MPPIETTQKTSVARWKEFVDAALAGSAREGVEIPESVTFAKLPIRSLPARMVVRGDLDLRQCARLREIGAGLEVEGTLRIGGRCPERVWYEHGALPAAVQQAAGVSDRLCNEGQPPLTHLPEGLRVGGDFEIRSCRALREFPDDISVRGSVRIEGCDALTAPPDWQWHTLTGGDLTIVSCRSLQRLPSSLSVVGDLKLVGLQIEELPRIARVGGSLTIESCPKLRALPETLEVNQDLIVRNCPIATLPPGLSVGRHLVVSRCPNLTTLPERLVAKGDMIVEQCPKFVSIPAGIGVGQSLKVTRCGAFTTLPEGLNVPNVLALRGCPALTALPPRLRVGTGRLFQRWEASLVVTDCPQLRTLPDDLRMNGALDPAGTPLTGMPPGLMSVPVLWRGVAVRAEALFRPEALSAAEIFLEPNAEVRRMILERLGCAAALAKAQARVVDEDTDPGGTRRLVELWPADRSGRAQRTRFLHCRCPSTQHEFLLRIPPETATCRAAAAWLAGFDDPERYQPIVET